MRLRKTAGRLKYSPFSSCWRWTSPLTHLPSTSWPIAIFLVRRLGRALISAFTRVSTRYARDPTSCRVLRSVGSRHSPSKDGRKRPDGTPDPTYKITEQPTLVQSRSSELSLPHERPRSHRLARRPCCRDLIPARRKPPVGHRAHRIPVSGGRAAVGDHCLSRRVSPQAGSPPP